MNDRIPTRRVRHRVISAALGLGLLLLRPTAASPIVLDTTTARVSIPFAGTIFDPDTNENIAVSGHLLVKVVIYYRLVPTRIRSQYKLGDDVTLVGATSGNTYVTRGHDEVKYFASSAGPIGSVDQMALFRLAPPGTQLHPNHSDSSNSHVRTWQVHYQIAYTPDGQVASTQADVIPDPVSMSCTTMAQVCNP
jgi:hypothetical protein